MAAPPMSWSPRRVFVTVGACLTQTAKAVFTAATTLGDASLRVVPELARLIAAAPASVTEIQAGSSFQVTLESVAAPGAALGVFDATLQVRPVPLADGGSGGVLARPLLGST
jgi:hypothetical protein